MLYVHHIIINDKSTYKYTFMLLFNFAIHVYQGVQSSNVRMIDNIFESTMYTYYVKSRWKAVM
jgi:hypothetical protein